MKNKAQRKRRTRKKVKEAISSDKPRLVVTRSNKYIYAQIIKPNGDVLAASDDRDHIDVKDKDEKTDRAKKVGKDIAKKAKEEDVDQVVFDRGPYQYQGRVEALAEGAREEGLNL